MTSPRSWNRREFNVTPAGFFTVLKPTGWFSASRLPAGFRYLNGPPKGGAAPAPASKLAPDQKALDHAVSQETTIPLQIVMPSAHDRRLVRLALIVLAAAALTLFVLTHLG